MIAKPNRGFTLIELLVSMAVLILLIAMIVGLTNSTATVFSAGRNRMDSDSQARLIFDRMAVDFAKMVKRQDVDCVFAKLDGGAGAGENDAMFFFSEAPAYFNSNVTGNASPVTLVGYRINFNNANYPNVPVLERLGKGLTWDGATSGATPGGMVFLANPGGSATPNSATTIPGNWTSLGTLSGTNNSAFGDGTDSDYSVLSDEVYRIEIQFLLTDQSISPNPVLSARPASWTTGTLASFTFYNQTGSDPASTSDSSNHYTIGSRWFNTSTKQGYICTNAAPTRATWNRIGVQDIAAVIVAIALLDDNSRKLVSSTSSYVNMVNALDDAPTGTSVSGTTVLQTWNGWNGSSYTNPAPFLTQSNIPKAAAAQIRVYQRYFYLNNN